MTRSTHCGEAFNNPPSPPFKLFNAQTCSPHCSKRDVVFLLPAIFLFVIVVSSQNVECVGVFIGVATLLPSLFFIFLRRVSHAKSGIRSVVVVFLLSPSFPSSLFPYISLLREIGARRISRPGLPPLVFVVAPLLFCSHVVLGSPLLLLVHCFFPSSLHIHVLC